MKIRFRKIQEDFIFSNIKNQKIINSIKKSISVYKSCGFKYNEDVIFDLVDTVEDFGSYQPFSLKGEKDLIHLSSLLQDASEEDIMSVVLHELAHYCVMHTIMSQNIPSDEKINQARIYSFNSHDESWQIVVKEFERKSGVKILNNDINLYKISPEKFHKISKKILKCKSCGNEISLDGFNGLISGFDFNTKTLVCPDCGGELYLAKNEEG